MQEPHLIELQKIGEEEIGYISVAQALSNVPFEIKRVYWIYATPETVERGNHAHKNTVQLLVCLHGAVQLKRGAEFQARSRSLMLVLARVWASTRLTMTAQVRLYLPPSRGRLPATTTEPAGTRP